jgi:hypothetical protein
LELPETNLIQTEAHEGGKGEIRWNAMHVVSGRIRLTRAR